MAITKVFTILDDDTAEIEVHLPALWCICTDCQGTGRSSAYLGAFTSDEWREQDDEFKDDYMAGRYDRPCDGCDGLGRTLELDRDRIITRADADEMAALAKIDEYARDMAETRSIERAERAERAMGA